MRLPITTAKIVVIVIIPKAPICTKIIIIICPNTEKLSPKLNMETPDTHTADADINNASTKLKGSISTTVIGNINNIVPVNIIIP